MTRYSDDAIPMKKRGRQSSSFEPKTNENSTVSEKENQLVDRMDSNDGNESHSLLTIHLSPMAAKKRERPPSAKNVAKELNNELSPDETATKKTRGRCKSFANGDVEGEKATGLVHFINRCKKNIFKYFIL